MYRISLPNSAGISLKDLVTRPSGSDVEMFKSVYAEDILGNTAQNQIKRIRHGFLINFLHFSGPVFCAALWRNKHMCIMTKGGEHNIRHFMPQVPDWRFSNTLQLRLSRCAT